MLFQRPTLILAYHRVYSLDFDPQLLAVSPNNFSAQMEVIKNCYSPVRLQDIFKRKFLPFGLPRIAITFDDGYADNLHYAKPILEQFDMPATFFITSGMIDSPHEFWWDELESIFFSNLPIPNTLKVLVNEVTHTWSDLAERDCSKVCSWSVLDTVNHLATPRQKAYLELSALIHPLSFAERERVIELLFDWASRLRVARFTHRTLTSDEVVRLNQGELMEIGGHSINHELFYELPEYRQKQEIFGSKAYLEELLKHEITSFAYPFGGRSHYSEWTPNLVKGAGFMRACSNFPKLLSNKCDPYQIPRFLVRDWGKDEFSSNLKKWLGDFK